MKNNEQFIAALIQQLDGWNVYDVFNSLPQAMKTCNERIVIAALKKFQVGTGNSKRIFQQASGELQQRKHLREAAGL